MLISVSNKKHIEKLGRFLEASGVEILSTGGSAKSLMDAGILVSDDVIRNQWNKADENIGMDLKPLKVSA